MVRIRPVKKKALLMAVTVVTVCTTGAVLLDAYCRSVFTGALYTNYKDFLAYHLKETVLQGLIIAPAENALFTKQENLSTTRLPVWEISLKGEKLAALNRDLPESGQVYQSGAIRINGVAYPARFRFRGDSFWHWMSKQKSWKIRLKDDARFEGKREFNLVNPKTTTALHWPVASYLARSMGLLTPRVEHVHARLNDRYLGVLYLLENFDHTFTVHNGLPEGALFEDEARGLFNPSWEELANWNIRPPDSNLKRQAGAAPADAYENYLGRLLGLARVSDEALFYQELNELVDLEQYLTWWAHAILCFDIHQDRQHNNRLYLDPTAAKFRPIPWDTLIGIDPQSTIDLNLNPIVEKLLQSPELIHQRNRVLWEALRGPVQIDKILAWIDGTADLIREDIYCDPYKDARFFTLAPLRSLQTGKIQITQCMLPVSNRMFERDVQVMKDFFIRRSAYLQEVLAASETDLRFGPSRSSDTPTGHSAFTLGKVDLRIAGQEGMVVREIRVGLPSLPADARPVLLYSKNGLVMQKEGRKISDDGAPDRAVYAFELDELLLPGRMKEPPYGPQAVRYAFTVAVSGEGDSPPGAPHHAEVSGEHPLTQRPIVLKAPFAAAGDKAAVPPGRFQKSARPAERVVWRGRMSVGSDRRISAHEVLVIEPGTEVAFAEGASLLSYGRVEAIGTEQAPILFTRAPDAASWGVLAVQGSAANGSVFEHCIFEHSGEDEMEGVHYSGALSLYNADAAVRHCVFRFSQGDDALNTKFSTTEVVRSAFLDNKADAYDLDFSGGLVAWNSFENNGNDAIDCGTSHPTISNNRILSGGDKGISIGERSRPVVENNFIARCPIGIAVKDQSQPVIRKNELVSNAVGVGAYQKKKVFGGVHATVEQCTFKGKGKPYETDAVSSLALVDCIIDAAASLTAE